MASALVLVAGCSFGGTPTRSLTPFGESSQLARKAVYSREWCLQTNLPGTPQANTLITSEWGSGSYEGITFIDVIFVASEQESFGLPPDVVGAWPTDDTEYILHNVNSWAKFNNEDFSSTGLAYPLTMSDVVGKWEEVRAFLKSMQNRDLALDPGYGTNSRAEWDAQHSPGATPSPGSAAASSSSPR